MQLSGRMVNDRGDTGAANSHQNFLQLEGVSAAFGLPPEDEDLLLDGNRVHGAVFLPLGIDTACMSAPGLYDLSGEAVGVPGDVVIPRGAGAVPEVMCVGNALLLIKDASVNPHSVVLQRRAVARLLEASIAHSEGFPSCHIP